MAADVGTEAGAEAVAADLAAAGQECAGVVAAAGGLTPDQPAASPLEQVRRGWQASFESNVLTAVLLVEALRADLERHGGRIVLVSSVAALRGSGGGPYGAMKAALHAWAYDLARELGPQPAAQPTWSRPASCRIPGSGPGGSPPSRGASGARRRWSAGKGRPPRWPR